MRLFEHPDFEQAILQAAEYFRERKLRPAIIEKDYYVTEALRLIATTSRDKIIFKGGTSLAKGWNLIQRFSEDIDIFLDPTAFQPALGKNAIDRELRKLRDTVGQHRLCRLLKPRAKLLAASVGMTASPTPSDSAGQAKSPTVCFSKLVQPVDVNHRPLWSCVRI